MIRLLFRWNLAVVTAATLAGNGERVRLSLRCTAPDTAEAIRRVQLSGVFAHVIAQLSRHAPGGFQQRDVDSLCARMQQVRVPSLESVVLVRALVGGGAEAEYVRFGVRDTRVSLLTSLRHGEVQRGFDTDAWNRFISRVRPASARLTETNGKAFACFLIAQIDNQGLETACARPGEVEARPLRGGHVEFRFAELKRSLTLSPHFMIGALRRL